MGVSLLYHVMTGLFSPRHADPITAVTMSSSSKVFADAEEFPTDEDALDKAIVDDADGDEPTEQHFHGFKLEPSDGPVQFSLEGIHLHITQLALDTDNASAVSRVYVETASSDKTLIATLRAGTPTEQVLLDLALYYHDGQVTLQVEGDAPVHFSGVVSMFTHLLDEESDEEEAAKEELAALRAAADGEGDEEDSEDEDFQAGEEEEEEEEEESEEEDDEAAQAAVAAALAAESKQKATGGAKRGRQPAPAAAAAGAAGAPSSAKKARKAEKVQTGKGGLKYVDLEPGMGRSPKSGKKVTVAYEGRLTNGKLFDSSNNFTFRLGVGKVIKGWDIGVASMKVGGKRKLIVPPHLGYGKAGAGAGVIPPNATLEFIVTLKNA
ncbi:fkbp4 [Symbiodinium sp. KB8]|nr:fkbp4 [Symbiodinium sp. KB8]